MSEFANSRFDARALDEDSPVGRWGHTSCVLKDQVLFFGGEAEECTEVQSIQPLLILNVNTYKFAQIFAPNGPRSRDSHTCVVVKDKVFVWGGCRNKAACNDCYCYTQGAWKQISQKGRVPQARESQAAGVLNNRYIMIYGGAKDYPLNDFHIFDTEDSTWYGLTRLEGDPFPLRDGSTMSVVKGSVVYLFGGKNDKDQYTNSMYRVILDNYQFEKRAPPPILKVEEVKCKGKLPRARSDHCAVVFQNKYIFILGGASEVEVPGGKPKEELINDIWALNLETQEWEELQPQKRDLFKRRCNFSAVVYEDDIIIFGGMTWDSKNPNHSDLLTLSLQPASKRLSDGPYETCGGCQSVFSETKEKHKNSSMVVSRASETFKMESLQLRSLAMLVGHPFKAVELILDYFLARRSQHIKFMGSSKNDHRFIRIVSGDSIPYFRYEAETVLCTFGLVYDCHTAETTNRNMKLACMRLSQSFILINTCGQEQSVALFAKGNIHYYTVNLKTGAILERSQQNTLLFIKEHISPYQFESKFFDGTQEIILLDPPKELVFTNDDIVFQRGISVPGGSIQLEGWESSLSERLSRHFLEPPNVRTHIYSRMVDFVNLKAQIAAEDPEGDAIVDCTKLPEARIAWHPDASTNFIGYYQNNRLVGWYSGRFKRQYSGYVVVPEEIPLNIFGSEFRSPLEKQQIDLLLQSMLEEHNTQYRLKRAPLVSMEHFVEEADSNPVKRQHKDS